MTGSGWGIKESLKLEVLGLGIFLYCVSLTKLALCSPEFPPLSGLVSGWPQREREGKNEAAAISTLRRSDTVAAQAYCWESAR